MKNFTITLLCIFMLTACESKRPIKECSTYVEMPDPNPVGEGWDKVSPGLNASFGTIDMRYPKSSVPEIKEKSNLWKGTGWKGERLSAQLVLWTTQNIKQAEFEISGFKSENGQALPSDIAKPHFVRYVMTDVFGEGCGYRKPEDFPASLSADILDNIECMDLDSNTVRPIWITFDIPRDAQPGTYKATITLFAKNNGEDLKQSLNVELEVLDQTLPPANEWSFHLDLWQHPTAVARWHNVPVWSDEHFELMRPLMQRLANAGQKVITATLNKDPWNGQCYDRYADMIKWTKKADGSWSYDYTAFDRWVSFMMELGVTKMINCYSMIPWNNEIHYMNEATNKMDTVSAEPGKPIFEQVWTPFLKDFTAHLKSKSWLEITSIAMDERSPETMKATIGLIRKEAPELGISMADNHKSYKEFTFIKDLCISYGATIDSTDLAYRKEKGLITTYYVCCSHKFPNVFTFSPPAEATFFAWHAKAAGLDGFLRWAYNSWIENPMLDTRFKTWPAGDTNIIYPENRSSIRFERLLEGIQDVEKIRILKEKLSKENTPESKQKLEKLESELAKFSVVSEAGFPCEKMLNSAKLLLNDLSK